MGLGIGMSGVTGSANKLTALWILIVPTMQALRISASLLYYNFTLMFGLSHGIE